MSHFIVFDGVECAGKSTQIQVAKEHLESLGYEVMLTREPGGTPIAEGIRELLLSPNFPENFQPNTELLLAYAAREQHIQSHIRPAIESGKVVLCDRFSSSTYIYQVKGHGASVELFEQLEKHIVKSFKEPDAYLIFDLDYETSRARLGRRAGETDRMERESEAFFRGVVENYQEFAQMKNDENPGQVSVIDASKTIPEVSATVKTAIDNIMDRKRLLESAKKFVGQVKGERKFPEPRSGGVLGL